MEGSLELSVSINSPNLIKHKINCGRRVHRSNTLSLNNFSEIFEVDELTDLKPNPTIIPLELNRVIVGYKERYMKGLN